MSFRHRLPMILSLAALTSMLATVALAGNWAGEVATIDGVKHVKNPAKAMESAMTVTLDENWRLGGDDEDGEIFGVISRVLSDSEGNVYILDSQLSEVKIYDADGNFLNTIGREGEGPGEFRNPSDMFFTPDGSVAVMQMMPGRIIKLTTEGDPAGELPLPKDETSGQAPFLLGGNSGGANTILAGWTQTFDAGKYEMVRFLASINGSGEEVARYHAETRALDFAQVVFDEEIWDTFDRRWATNSAGTHVYACVEHFPYKINVWNADGSLAHIIEREYKRHSRSKEDMERVEAIYEGFTRRVPGNSEYKIYDTNKDIQAIYPRNDGSLWVLTSRGMHERPDGSIGTFDVFNRDGHFVREVTLMGEGDPNQDSFLFVDNRLYVLTGFLEAAMAAQGGGGDGEEAEDLEAEPMGIICYNLDVPDMGS